MKKHFDQKVILQLVHSEHGVRSGEFATTFREASDLFEKSILPENHDKNLVLVLMQEDDSGEMKFSTNAIITVSHFISIVKEQSNG